MNPRTSAKNSAPQARRTYKYYDMIMAAFVTVLLCSDLIAATKVATINLFGHDFIFGAGILFFPLSYVFGDVLTEVYGFARSRKVVWTGFAALLFASVMAWVVVHFTPAPGWNDQDALQRVFGSTWRIVLASLTAYCAGEFVNSFVLAKMKMRTEGKHLWLRTIGSTIAGEGVDSLIFYPLAFYGVWENQMVVKVLIMNYFLKVGWEIVMTPFTYKVVNFLKRAESEDYYDWDTDFTPFSIQT